MKIYTSIKAIVDRILYGGNVSAGYHMDWLAQVLLNCQRLSFLKPLNFFIGQGVTHLSAEYLLRQNRYCGKLCPSAKKRLARSTSIHRRSLRSLLTIWKNELVRFDEPECQEPSDESSQTKCQARQGDSINVQHNRLYEEMIYSIMAVALSSKGGEQKLMLKDSNQERSTLAKCSFCGKSQNQVIRLTAGPGKLFICNECVDLYREHLEKTAGEAIMTEKLMRICSSCGTRPPASH